MIDSFCQNVMDIWTTIGRRFANVACSLGLGYNKDSFIQVEEVSECIVGIMVLKLGIHAI